ncbi:MAG TPA: class I SAM-dependent methyltransferase [Solirubrobacterales bacterium]|nr:class I SAM-dependent methyltransferase [Solirubrobacterales bacterium]
MPTEPRGYLPALRFSALTRIYDPVVRVTTREGRFKEMLVEQVAPAAGQRILDLGCGTGTLAIQVKRREPGAEVVGLDADPEMLGRARAKAERENVELRLAEGMSDELPFEDESFDRVLSTLFFHHLDPEPKRRTACEIARVLRKGGELHVADWGAPADTLMAAAFLSIRVLDGFENTADNVRGELSRIFEEAGLENARQTDRIRTVFGTLALFRAGRPD